MKIFHLDVAQAFVRAKLDAEIYIKLPDGCGDMSGTVIISGGAPVSWASSTQRCVTLSTAAAEYVALGEAVKEALSHTVA